MLTTQQRNELATALRNKVPVFYRDEYNIFHRCTRVQLDYKTQDEEPEDAEDVVWLHTATTGGVVRCAALSNVSADDFLIGTPLFAA